MSHIQSDIQCMLNVQAAQLWLQYISLLSGVNLPTPHALQWVFSAANYFFSAVSSGSLSVDCLFSTHHDHTTAVQRILVHLAVSVLVLLAMVLIQVIW